MARTIVALMIFFRDIGRRFGDDLVDVAQLKADTAQQIGMRKLGWLTERKE